jgi:DnaJ-class molecular chaperone
LNVEVDASSQEIKEAYLKLSKENHPDVNQSENAKHVFQEITEAYEVLGSVNNRRDYDKNTFVSRLRKSRPRQNVRQDDTSRPSYENIHRIIKEQYKHESEIFKEWASSERSEKLGKNFEELSRKDSKRYTPKQKPRRETDWQDFENECQEDDKIVKDIEEKNRAFNVKARIFIVIALISAYILECM